MFLKSICLSAMVAAVQVSAHAAINPVLGVKAAKAVRNDVQRPNNNNPCGNTDIAKNIDSSTAVTADASGSFTVAVENFNGGQDGSRKVTVKVDASGAGNNFVDGAVSKNGDDAPADNGTEQIIASLPAGITCAGGAAGNLCLASFVTGGGFGNCVVVQQGQGGGGAAAGGDAAGKGKGGKAAANTGGDNNGNAKGGNGAAADDGDADGKAKGNDAKDSNNNKQARQASGTRRARAMIF